MVEKGTHACQKEVHETKLQKINTFVTILNIIRREFGDIFDKTGTGLLLHQSSATLDLVQTSSAIVIVNSTVPLITEWSWLRSALVMPHTTNTDLVFLKLTDVKSPNCAHCFQSKKFVKLMQLCLFVNIIELWQFLVWEFYLLHTILFIHSFILRCHMCTPTLQNLK